MDGKQLVDPVGPSAGMLGLVGRHDANAPRVMIFTHADELIADPGRYKKLTLRSHPGFAIMPSYATPMSSCGEPEILPLEIGLEEDALICTYDGGFLSVGDMVFDVAMEDYQEGNKVRLLRGKTEAKTREAGCGREWVVNPDGTISPKGHDKLVLGILEADNEVSCERMVTNSKPEGSKPSDEVVLGEEPTFFDLCVYDLNLPVWAHARSSRISRTDSSGRRNSGRRSSGGRGSVKAKRISVNFGSAF
jgi:hypothetical protein